MSVSVNWTEAKGVAFMIALVPEKDDKLLVGSILISTADIRAKSPIMAGHYDLSSITYGNIDMNGGSQFSFTNLLILFHNSLYLVT